MLSWIPGCVCTRRNPKAVFAWLSRQKDIFKPLVFDFAGAFLKLTTSCFLVEPPGSDKKKQLKASLSRVSMCILLEK